MNHVASEVIAAACGYHIPVWGHGAPQVSEGKTQSNEGVDKLLHNWPRMPCHWVPAHIAYGLLENMVLDQAPVVDEQGNLCTLHLPIKGKRAPEDQEFHQQMLQKLALHLAAQPDTQHGLRTPDTAVHALNSPALLCNRNQESHSLPVARSSQDSAGCPHHAPSAESANLQKKACQGKGAKLSAQDQEFQQEMLRKLALHLAAHDQSTQDHMKEGEVKEVVTTPDVFPATPSSFGDERCEHYFIGDDNSEIEVEERTHCLPSCVWVPAHVSHGLLRGIESKHEVEGQVRRQANEFHQQMLQKLALHLAAQPQPLQAPSSAGQKAGQVSVPQNKTAWADMEDDDESPQHSLSPPIATRARKCGKECSEHYDTKTIQTVPHPKTTGPGPDKIFQQEMLQKLALHLAAQPDQTKDAGLNAMNDAKLVGEDKAHCQRLISDLAPTTDGMQTPSAEQVIAWVKSCARTLSLTQHGCRVVQTVVDMCSTQEREQLLEGLLQDVMELCTSPHANHVIAKLVEIMPSGSLSGILSALRGKATTVARHQFGSRILERLIEHGSEIEIGPLLEELLVDIEALARHPFGNYVVARILEHATPNRKHTCVQKLLPYVLQHATHKTACNIVQRMLDNSDLASRALIADAFLAGIGDTSLEAIASTRYGSFVIQHLVDRFHPRIDAVKARVKAAHAQLAASAHSEKKIVQFLGEGFFRD